MKNAESNENGGVKSRGHSQHAFLHTPFSRSAVALAVLFLLALAMFGDVLFTTQSVVLSSRNADLFNQFIHWRKFGFEQLRHGNLALWNPHLFSGAPFFGGFQSALLYPPNFLFLILPLAKAINFGIALHVFLGGAFTYFWATNRGLHPLASFLSAVMFMFCGAHFLHIYAGHLPNLCTLIWAPLLFLAIDRLFAIPSLGPCLLGTFAVAMQILAGHPQYVFYTAVAATIYSALCLIKSASRLKVSVGFIAIYLGGAALSAVQLLTGLAESRETLRSIGTSYEFAAMFSFPPENLLTLVAPTFFGNLKDVPYWGRCYLWEMSLFFSVTGLVLAIYGAAGGERATRRFSVSMVVILFVLALGAHTPLFEFLYKFVPGFDKFRGNSKFIFLASLFLAMLAGIGLDGLLKTRRVTRSLILFPLIAGVVLATTALCLRGVASPVQPDGAWTKILNAIYATKESYLPGQIYGDAGFQLQTCRHAAGSLAVAAVTFALVSGLFFVARRSPQFLPALVVVAVVELFIFARSSLATFDLAAADTPGLKTFLAEHPGDYRILNQTGPNVALSLPANDLWGYDPGVLLRYAEFMAFTQGMNPDEVTQYIPFRRMHRLYSMLRCRFAFVPGKKGAVRRLEFNDVLPRLLLVQRYRVMGGRNEMFTAMDQPSFNPREEVLLENVPTPAPTPTKEQGTVKLVDSSTDRLTIEADLPSPAILLITDTYANGWRARALPESSQQQYQVTPANYCLRAIPLAAGHHRIRVEYTPVAFRIGVCVSIISLLAFVMLAARWLQRVGSVKASGRGS